MCIRDSGELDPECWDKTLDWFLYFLRGVDTGVDAWPALQTVDANGGPAISFDDPPVTRAATYYLREPQLTTYAPTNTTITVQQRVINNPLQEPSVVYDQTSLANQAIPYSMRNDPTAVFFEGAPVDETQVLLGAPRLDLHVTPTFNDTAFQVAVQLISVDDEDNSRILSRGAYAHVPGVTEPLDDTVTVDLHFTKADLQPGTRLVLKVGGNDVSWYLPFFNGNDPASSNYSMQFTGQHVLTVPFFEA